MARGHEGRPGSSTATLSISDTPGESRGRSVPEAHVGVCTRGSRWPWPPTGPEKHRLLAGRGEALRDRFPRVSEPRLRASHFLVGFLVVQQRSADGYNRPPRARRGEQGQATGPEASSKLSGRRSVCALPRGCPRWSTSASILEDGGHPLLRCSARRPPVRLWGSRSQRCGARTPSVPGLLGEAEHLLTGPSHAGPRSSVESSTRCAIPAAAGSHRPLVHPGRA